MGAGKTTVGRLLAGRLGRPFVDTDHLVEARAGRRIADVFASDGEEAFRDLEQAAVAEALAGPEAVVSLGGGACGRPATRELLAAHTVVHLDVSLPAVRERTRGDADRPVLRRPGLDALHAARRAVYADVAALTVPTDDRTAADVAAEVADRTTHPLVEDA
ncbi:shikimate kinase [Kineococcus sp. R8]|nr:shikimate kinase [Kineococcus siccus]NAZ83719.1 shikimate kinase [Kineococcus siccus]